jgi:hypothetical protein
MPAVPWGRFGIGMGRADVRAALRSRAGWLATLGMAAVLLSACEEGDSAPSSGAAWPPGAAGLACNYVEYDRVADTLGVRFDTAGGARKDDTHSCALTQAGREYPDLALSVTATSIDNVIFHAAVAPGGSTLIKGVGRIAYQLDVAASGKRGPGLEVGWLSARGRLMVVRYTFEAQATAAEVNELAPRLVALAKQIEATTGTAVS